MLPNPVAQPTGAISPSDDPANTASDTSWNYLGQHQKLTETNLNLPSGIIQMGARVYIPTLGRFLSVDPVEGAGDSAYSYVNDPVNENDLDGKIASLVAMVAWQLGRIAIQQTIKIAVKHVAQQATKQVVKKTAVQATKKAVQWSAGKPHNAARNAAQHYTKHAKEIGARTQKAYNNSARNTVLRSTQQHTYKNGYRAYMDTRGRISVINTRGKVVTHFKNKHPQRYWNGNIRGR